MKESASLPSGTVNGQMNESGLVGVKWALYFSIIASWVSLLQVNDVADDGNQRPQNKRTWK